MKPYILAVNSGITKLEKNVARLIEGGYIPVGGVVISKIGLSEYYYQPMVLKEVIYGGS